MPDNQQPQKPIRRMGDGTPCWCISDHKPGDVPTWTHSPRCLAIRALQGGYDFAEPDGPQGKRRVMSQRTKKTAFIREYANSGILTTTCDTVGIEPSTVYRWRDADPVFATLMVWAGEHAVDLMEQEARRRAVHGVTKPVFQGGREVGQQQEYSDTLLIFLLKGARPSKYRERLTVDIDIRKVAEEIAAAAGGEATADAVLREAERILAGENSTE